MRRLFLVCFTLLVALTTLGCGEMPSAESASKPKKKKSTSTAQPMATAPEVSADSYASVEAALAEAERLTKSGDVNAGRELLKIEMWLEMQGAAIAGELSSKVNDGSQGLATRMTACRVLSRLGAVAKPTIMQASQSDTAMLRVKAIECLGKIKPSDDEIIKRLLTLLEGKEFSERKAALGALANVGPAAKDAVPKLVAILNDQSEDETIRGAAKKALKEVDPRKGLMNAY